MLSVARDAVTNRGPEPRIAMPQEARDEEFREDAPFIEVGGPRGPVFSHPPAPPVVAPAPAAVPPEIAPFPRLASPAPAYLSVRFHEVSARPKAAPRLDGPALELVAYHLPDHPVSGEYRTFRDEIRQQLPEAVPHALLFTAAAAEAGTTTVLLNLAVSLACDGKGRVLVLDANVARPTVAARLALKERARPGRSARRPGALGLGDSAVRGAEPPGARRRRVQRRHDAGLHGRVPEAARPAAAVVRLGADRRRRVGRAAERDAACPGADAVYLVTREADAGRTEFDGLRGWVRELGGLLRGFVTTRV